MKNGKICTYINAYIANNLGDDMFIIALCNHYKMIDFYIEIPDEYTETFSILDNLFFLSSNEKKNTDLISMIDFQILIGGSLFMEPVRKEDIYSKFKKRTSYRLSSNIPFFIIGANFGEFKHNVFFKLYRCWFETLNGICFRDIQSYKLFKNLSNVICAPDLLFTYEMPIINKTNNNIVIAPIYKTDRTGMPSFSNEEYQSFLSQIAQEYINRGFNVILASFCTAQLDDKACENIYSNIPDILKPHVKIIYYKANIEIFLRELINAKYIIGTRFHSLIIAMKNRIPVFPIIYNIKTKNMLESIHFKGKYTDITNLSSIDFEVIDRNRKEEYILNVTEFEVKAYLHYHFFNEALIKKLNERKDIYHD